MIGIIVTGHNHFATGIKSAVEFITGTHEKFVAVDFDNTEEAGFLKRRFTEVLEGELKDCEEVICYCDLLSGSPYQNILALSVTDYPKVDVVFGTNLPLLIESVVARDNDMSKEDILASVEYCKDAIGILDKSSLSSEDDF